MIQTPEQLDELIQQTKRSGQKHADDVVSALISMPKAEIPSADFLRVKSQILDRISLPASMKSEENSVRSGFMAFLPRILRITGGIVGSFTILLSMSIGASAAAANSVPGQAIYPLKKLSENVRMQLARSDEQRTTLQIQFANNRIDELEAVLKRQKQGKISQAEAQKIVADLTADLKETSEELSVKESVDAGNVSVLTKIVDLSNKQTSVIQAAQAGSEGEVKVELDKALESSKITKEQAIENIEKAGLVVEEQPLTLADADSKNQNEVTTEGRLTTVTSASVSIGTVQFLLTKDTEYANINSVDLKVGAKVKIYGELVDKKTYAVKIELVSPPETAPTPTITPTPTEPTITPTPTETGSENNSSPETVPADPSE